MAKAPSVETLVVLTPIKVDTASPDSDGRLVMANGMLVAILIHLDAPDHENMGSWFLEAGFGRLQRLRSPTFDTLEQATRWVRAGLRS